MGGGDDPAGLRRSRARRRLEQEHAQNCRCTGAPQNSPSRLVRERVCLLSVRRGCRTAQAPSSPPAVLVARAPAESSVLERALAPRESVRRFICVRSEGDRRLRGRRVARGLCGNSCGRARWCRRPRAKRGVCVRAGGAEREARACRTGAVGPPARLRRVACGLVPQNLALGEEAPGALRTVSGPSIAWTRPFAGGPRANRFSSRYVADSSFAAPVASAQGACRPGASAALRILYRRFFSIHSALAKGPLYH